MNQPVHWRASYFKTERSHQIYVRRHSDDARSPGKDHGQDNFSYDPAHLHDWEMPTGLAETLPLDLRQAAQNWEKAGAALCTALQRTHHLHKEAVDRAYPTKSYGHLHHRTSSQTSVVAGADSPPMSSPESPSSSATVATQKIPRLPLSVQQDLGVESPPMTPVDSGAASTPVHPAQTMKTAVPDLSLVTTQLSPLSSQTSYSPAPPFDESSWERYLKIFDNQLQDDKEALCRLKGYARTMDTLSTEYKRDEELQAAMRAFAAWWVTAKPKIAEYEEKYQSVKAPVLDDVRVEWQMAPVNKSG